MSDPLLVAHLILVSAWGGLVVGESVLELSGRDEATRALAARLHLWMDLLGELPLILAVLVTGSLLAGGRDREPGVRGRGGRALSPPRLAEEVIERRLD